MKHRSVIAFILLVAALFAAPQISHDIMSLKSAVVARVRGEVMRAFLSLGGREGAGELAARRAGVPVATCAQEKEEAQAAAKSKRSEAHATAQADTSARQDRQEQLAMLVSPSLLAEGDKDETSGVDSDDANANVFDTNIVDKRVVDKNVVDKNAVDTNVVVGSAAQLSRRILTRSELAMIIPPDADVVVHAPADARANDASETSASRRKQESDETRRRADYVAARFAVRKVEWQASGDSLLRSLHAVLPASYEFHVGGDGRRGKVLKFRRGGVGRGVATPAAFAPQPGRQVAHLAPAPQPPAAE